MSFNKFIQDLENLEKLTYETGFDISNYFLPDKEILKNLLSEKSPNLSKIDIDIMSESAFSADIIEEVDLKESNEDKQNRINSENETKKVNKKLRESGQQIYKNQDINSIRKEREDKLRESKKIRAEELKSLFKEKLEQLKIEITELKDKIRSAAFQFSNKFKEVSSAFISALVKTITSIPGAILAITAPPWNLPLAVTTLLVVVVDYLDLLAKLQELVPFFQPLKKLPILISKNKLNTVGKIMDVFVLGAEALYAPIKGFSKIIKSIFDFIKSLFSDKKKEKTFKQATKKLIKLGHIESINKKPVMIVDGEESKIKLRKIGDSRGKFELDKLDEDDNPGSVEIFSYNEEDVEEILSILSQFKFIETKKWGGEKHAYDYRKDNKKLLDQLDQLEKDISDYKIPNDINTNDFDQFVYDINLPDGTILTNITEEGLEYYRKNFDLKITN